MPLPPNTRLGRYEIRSQIGAGGMGEVYLAEDTRLRRRVALKVLPDNVASDKERLLRFEREAVAASALNHPNIITIYEIGESEGTHFIATELIDGKTLGEYARANRLDDKAVLEIAIQIASALTEAHEAGIVHRDIKPDNVMVRPNGLVKILDFGIAKLSAPSASDAEAATAIKSATQAGMIIGTASYMSPEQAAGRAVDARSDIFSFGVVLYEMLSGRLPFAGETAMEMIGAILKDEPPPLGANVPVELKDIVGKCLRKNLGERYQAIKEACTDLREFKQELEFQDKLERTSVPNRAEQQTQILKAQATAEESPQATTRNQQSIVVLPFSNIGGDAEDDYFSDGLTEEIISDLSKIRALRVISRNSAMRLKNTTKDLQTVARELDVRYVLDGSVRKAGENLRISAQLIEAATDAVLWSEKYSGTLADVFEMQESVSHSIAGALEITLTTGEIKEIGARPIADARAYDLYLRARANFQRGVPEALDRSIELLKQGLEIIGENELLYAALGYAYYFYFRWISKLDENYLRLANECLEKTIAINPDSSHGFTLKGLLSYSRGQMTETIASLTRAVETDPANTEALLWLVVNLNYIGRGEESKQHAERLISIDPLTPINIFICGFAHVYSGEFDKFSPFLERALAVDSSSPLIIWSAVVLESWGGNINKAIAHVDNLAELAPGWVYTEHALFLKHALRGEKELALTHYTPDFEKEAEYDCHFALHVAHCFALLREKDRALDFLALSVRKGMLNYSFIGKSDPLLENIRGEQRFKDLMSEARRLSETIYGKRGAGSGFQNKPETGEEVGTQILRPTSAAEKSAASNTDSEQGFWVAVLPFKYRRANADLADLADGLSEEIIIGLSRFSYLRVISRGSTLSHADDSGDVRTIGKELGARYVLEGSLRQSGVTVRIAAQLVDTTTGAHLWAETYDRALQGGEIFAVQDELVPRIVSTVADQHGVLVHSIADAIREKDKNQITPSEAVFRVFSFHERVTPENHAVTRDLLEYIVRKFPNEGNCWAMLETLYCDEYMFGFNCRPDSLGRALATAQRAVELAPTSNLACQALAQAHFFRREFEAFRPLAERAIALNPMDGATVAFMGVLIACSGEWERGCEVTKQAMRLNPHFPGWYRLAVLFDAYRRGDYRAALAEAEKINLPHYFWTLVTRTASLGQLGERERAREALKELLAARPDFANTAPEEYGRWFDAELVEHLMDGFRKAGLEITSAPTQGEPKNQLTAAPSETGETENLKSIAVLPFANVSADEENEYFCDGLAEELLNALSKIEDLRVAARTSAFSFKGKNAEAREIGEKLSVKNILEGSVRRSGNKLRIAVQLINAANGFQLWSERYDREMKDIFDVQDEISLAVVDALKVKLFGEEKAAVLKRHTRNAEAHEYYLHGLFHFNRFTPDGFQKAIEYFNRAIAVDNRFASAFAGLANAYVEMAFFTFSAPGEWMPKARKAVNTALALDATLDEAHNSLAIIKMYYDLDYPGAEREFKRALALNPGNSNICMWYAWYLGLMGRFEESFEAYRRALELDPLSEMINTSVGIVYYWAGQQTRAVTGLQKVLEVNPHYSLAQSFLAEAYAQRGDFAAAAATAASLRQSANDPLTLPTIGYVYGKIGDRQAAQEILTAVEQRATREYVSALNFAQIYAGLGDTEQTLAWLEKACRERPFWITFVKVDPKFDFLRSDPRFIEMLNRIGFPPEKSVQTDEALEAKTVMLQPDTADKTAEVEQVPESTTNPKSEIRNPKSKWRLFGLLGLLLLVGGYFSYRHFAPANKQIESIAVMPFANESGDADAEYLSDGMTETLISSLSQIPNLSVKARSTVFFYKGKEVTPKKIGEELGVQAVLLGRVGQRGDDLRLSLELVNAQTQDVLWSETYNRKQSDLLTLQTDIARDVSSKIKSKLSGEEIAKITKTYTINTEAYQLYLKGNYYRTKYTEEGYKKGIEYYQKAIELDPNYALAYNGIAWAYMTANEWYLAPSDAMPKSKAAVLKALELDDSLADAHFLLGRIAFFYDWDWANVEREMKRAHELDPTYAPSYATYLASVGKFDEAIQTGELAQLREPLDFQKGYDLAFAYLYAGRFDEAIAQDRKMLEIDPNYWGASENLGLAFERKKQFSASIAVLEKTRVNDNNPEILGYLGYVYAASGKKVEALKILDNLKRLSGQRYVSPYYLAIIYGGLNDKDQAFEWLNKAYYARSGNMPTLKVDVINDNLRDDPRFKDLLKRMNLPE